MEGWVKVYRQLLKKPIWKKSTPEHKSILITLLLMANHESNEWEWEGKKFTVKPGQFITSIDSIKKECGRGISFQNIRSALARFQNLGFLTNQSTKTGRLITILNWEDYQGNGNKTNKDTNKEVTKNQQRGNKEVTTNKNDKNDKNDKKKYREYVSMTETDYQKLIEKHGKDLIEEKIEDLNLYKKSKGKKYKCDYSTVLAWIRKDEREGNPPKKKDNEQLQKLAEKFGGDILDD